MRKIVSCGTGCGKEIELSLTGTYRRIQRRVYCHKCCEVGKGANALRFKGTTSFYPLFSVGAEFHRLCGEYHKRVSALKAGVET